MQVVHLETNVDAKRRKLTAPRSNIQLTCNCGGIIARANRCFGCCSQYYANEFIETKAMMEAEHHQAMRDIGERGRVHRKREFKTKKKAQLIDAIWFDYDKKE